MKYRTANRLGVAISEIGLGAWAIGGDWGDVEADDAVAAIEASLDAGVTFIDTADVYGDGRSEKLIAQTLAKRGDPLPLVATKAGRRLKPHVSDAYTGENIERFIDRSLSNLGVDSLDLLQLHCPPTDVYYRPELFEKLDRLKAAGKIQRYGVSVEKVEEALKAVRYPGVASVQIIFNIFRQRPAEALFAAAKDLGVAIIARVPLASGLLTGRMSARSTFAETDHRSFNRHGQAFDVGETFAGVPFEVGLQAVEELRPLVPAGVAMAAFALKWILMNDAVTTVIPGAKNAAQATANAAATDLPEISAEAAAAIDEIYVKHIRHYVDQRW
jgi:aryl-alcohol dehydrogenase-like predicted oxidoreductase